MTNIEKVLHASKVKESLGNEVIEVLSTIFESSTGNPPAVKKRRFRADHHNWIEGLDKIERDHYGFIEFDRNENTYRVKCSFLPLIDSPKAAQLLDVMEKVFPILKKHYQESLDEPLFVKSIVNEIDEDDSITKIALVYMHDVGNWWSSIGGDFPEGDDSTIQVSENILLQDNFFKFISQFYEWYYINPKKLSSPSIVQTVLMSSSGKDGAKIEPKAPELLQNLEWVRQYGMKYKWHIIVAALFLMVMTMA